MKLISAKEAKEITTENLRNTAIEQVMSRIINAAKNGQYGLSIRNDYSKEQIEGIRNELLDLGYSIQTITRRYVGTLKEYTEIIINWYD